MPPRLADRLLDEANGYGGDFADLLREAAAELDRREAIVAAAEAWAHSIRRYEYAYNEASAKEMQQKREALLALIQEEPHAD